MPVFYKIPASHKINFPHNVFLVQTYGFVEWAMTGVELLIKLPYYDYL